MVKIFKNFYKNQDSIALIDNQFGNFKYKDLLYNSDKIKKIIKSNSVALLIADNNSEFVAGYVAFLSKKNIISILVDRSFSIEFILKMINSYKPNYIFTPKDLVFNKKNYEEIFNFKSYGIFKTKYREHKELNFKNFLLISTSGTTASPKFVRLSKTNLEENVLKISHHLNIKKNHTTITTMPMGYSYGLSILNTHLQKGSKIVINKSTLLEKIFWKKITDYKVNSFGGVPEFYEFLKRIDFQKISLSSIKYLTQAGGRLNEETLRYYGNLCLKKKIKFYVMYGQSEAGPRMTLLDWNMFYKKINSIGKPLKGCKINLVTKNNKIIKKANKEGEIVFYGKNVSLGYCKNIQDLKKGDVNKKILHTGDIAYRDNENFYYISGRKKRFIKLFGKRLDLKEIESFLSLRGIKVRCNTNDLKLTLNLYNNFKREKFIKTSLSKYLNINQNYILIKKNFNKTFKDF